MGELFWMAAKAFFIALILTPIIRDIFRSFNVVDRPGTRKVHVHPVPRVGGVAIAISYGLSLIAFSGLDRPWSGELGPWKVIPGAAIAFGVGLLDDLFSLRPVIKLAGLILAACVAFESGLHVGAVLNQDLPGWIDFPLTVFWLVLASNALNLIDGLDGLCAGMGLLSTLTLFTAALLHGDMPLAYATLPLAGALLGFLCHNFYPGDCIFGRFGGFADRVPAGQLRDVLDSEEVYAAEHDCSLAGAFDSAAGRVSLGSAAADRAASDFFERPGTHSVTDCLTRAYFPRQAVGVLYLVGALAAAFALMASSKFGGTYEGAIIVLFCAAAWVGVRKLRYSEFDLGGRPLLDPFVKAKPDANLLWRAWGRCWEPRRTKKAGG